MWNEGSMLAESRYKKVYSPDPRGTRWSKDESKFGQRMLERMGWSKGKGLGVEEKGITEHIQVSVKNNMRGLGCSAKQADYWLEHQNDFNALLQTLNQDSNSGSGGSDREAGKVSSLEQKSKSSRARVHYHKFAKGKDLSSRSEHDLACIFGHKKHKKSKDKPEEEETKTAEEGKDEKNGPASAMEEQGTSHGVVTIQRELSVQQYFQQKMEQLKKLRSGAHIASAASRFFPSAQSASEPGSPARSCNGGPALENATNLPPAAEEAGAASDSSPQGTSTLEPTSRKKKKSKKRKREDAEDEGSCPAQEDLSSVPIVDMKEYKVMKKKAKKRKVEEQPLDNIDIEAPPASPTSEPCKSKKKKKNKKKKSELLEESVEEAADASVRKRKRVSFAETLVQSVTLDMVDDSMNARLSLSALQSPEAEDASDAKRSQKKRKKEKKEKKSKAEGGENGADADSRGKSDPVGSSAEVVEPSGELAPAKRSKKNNKGQNAENGSEVENDAIACDQVRERGCDQNALTESLDQPCSKREKKKERKEMLTWKSAVRLVKGYSHMKVKAH